MVKCDLPKVESGVRFSSPAPLASVAQLIEQCFRKAEVVGLNPTVGSSSDLERAILYLEKIKECFWNDVVNRYCLIVVLSFGLIEYFLWQYLSKNEYFIFYTPYSYYPLQVYLIIAIIHLFISYSSYKINTRISNFLLGFLTIYGLFIIVLEIYYWVQL